MTGQTFHDPFTFQGGPRPDQFHHSSPFASTTTPQPPNKKHKLHSSPPLYLSPNIDQKLHARAASGDAIAQLAHWGLQCMYNKEDVVHLCAVSAAETALVQASGRSQPRECWGYNSPTHVFRECPQKHDPQVFKTFIKRIEQEKESGRPVEPTTPTDLRRPTSSPKQNEADS
jgi:hypothetical protein